MTTITNITNMDHPEVSDILFYPRRVKRTPLPHQATDINIQVEADIIIGCRLFTADKNAATILLFHGNGETVPDYDTIGSLYQQVGLNFLITDYRGYGWSTGEPSFSTMLKDGDILHRQLKLWLDKNGYSDSLFLMGRSLGSGTAIDLAAKHNEDIKGIIIESGFAETIPLAETLGIDLSRLSIKEEDTFNNLEKIKKITKPTLIIHGQLDNLIPAVQAEKLMADSGARGKEFFIIPGADHNTLIAVASDYYFQAIKKFIDKIEGNDDWRNRRRKTKTKLSYQAEQK